MTPRSRAQFPTANARAASAKIPQLARLAHVADLGAVLQPVLVGGAGLDEQAAALHGFYHDCYVMSDAIAPELTQARLALVAASQVGLQIALQLLGVSAPEAM